MKRDTFWEWWKKDNRYQTLCKALFMALLPFFCCVVTCKMDGHAIRDVYLPNSEWNDELFYFKQVESIVNYGFPQGYYGFNESRALKLSFAAWSPVLVLPWVCWGLLFGWNLMSPVICNILLLTVSVFLFVWLVKPTWKQEGVLALLFCLYTPFARYMLSGMPEIICFSLLILFYGLAVNYQRSETVGKLAGLFLLSGFLTLMRPYMLLFLLLPVFFRVRAARRKGKMWIGLADSGVILAVVLGCYAMLKHYLGAEYFHPLFFTDWITTFFEEGFGAGVRNFFGTLYWKGKDFYAHTVQGVRTGLASGAFFAGYLVTMTILLWQSVADGYQLWHGRFSDRKGGQTGRKESGRKSGESDSDAPEDIGEKMSFGKEELSAQFVVETHLLFAFVGMLFALLLMYKLTEGSKHLLTFMAAGIFVIALMRTRTYKKAVFLGAAFVFLYSYRAVEPYDYQVPFAEAEQVAQIERWHTLFGEELVLKEEAVPNYENVVIWVFNEQSAEGQIMKWQMLYALPEGFGISCCQKDYVLEHLTELNSRYLFVQRGAEVDLACEAAGYRRVAADDDLVLYDRL